MDVCFRVFLATYVCRTARDWHVIRCVQWCVEDPCAAVIVAARVLTRIDSVDSVSAVTAMAAHMMVSFAPAAALTLLQQAPVGRHPGSRPRAASMTVQTAGSAPSGCLPRVHRRQQPWSPTALEIGVVAHSPAGKSTATVRWTGESAEDSHWGCCGAHAVWLNMPTCRVCTGSEDHTYRAIVSGLHSCYRA
jgi:hypothetical protein